jgi:hypothetical protein
MKVILILLGRLGLALLALYAALLLVCLLLVPRDAASRPIDTARAPETLYLTEPKLAFLARERLAGALPKLVVLGASNAMAGFKQRELQPLLPELEVHNLSLGGANLTEIAQLYELVREVQSEGARRKTSYVIGLWYGVFASDRARWFTPDRVAGDTDIDIERYRYGFYRRTPRGAEPVLPARWLGAGVTLIHPYLVLERVSRDATAALREELSGKPKKLGDRERNERVITSAEQRDYLAFWERYMGDAEQLDAATFDRLEALVRSIVADGSQVLLVDMPIPAWHERGSRLAADYERRLQQLLPRLTALSGVGVLQMANERADDDFSDEVHPKPRVSPRWAARVASALRLNTPNVSASNLTGKDGHG